MMVKGIVIIAMRWIQVFGSKKKATKTTAPYFIMVIFPAVSQPPTQRANHVDTHTRP